MRPGEMQAVTQAIGEGEARRDIELARRAIDRQTDLHGFKSQTLSPSGEREG
jgi:hypothetical protein